MNRKVLLIISMFVFIGFSQTTNAQTKKKSDVESEGLRGKVMSVKEKHYVEKRIFFGLIPIKEVYWVQCSTYNKDGSIIYSEMPSIDGKYKRYYKYNEKGSCIEMLDYNCPTNGKEKSTLFESKFIYDNDGNEIREFFYSNNELMYWNDYKYDNNRNLIEEIAYENETSPIRRVHIRDTNGNVLEVRRYNKLGEIDLRNIYEYDEKNNQIKKQRYSEDNTLMFATIYKYNKEGDKTESNQIESNAKYFSSYKYKYDSKGNWIKRIEYNEDKSVEYITKREIEYYDE